MQLQVAATYQPTEDEVWVDIRSTDDDLTTVTVADDLELRLLLETKNSIGAVSYTQLSSVKMGVEYQRPDRNYEATFRHPLRKMDLYIEAVARFGAQTYVKRVAVGEALSSKGTMDLPDNVIYEKDVSEELLSGGGNSLPIENVVVLAAELREHLKAYDFTAPSEEYDGLVYLGGGNRLLINNVSNQFEAQNVDQAPWAVPSFVFLEPAGENLVPNAFFLDVSGENPAGYSVETAGAIPSQTVVFDYSVSAGAKIWVTRLIQQSTSTSFRYASWSPDAKIEITAEQTYTFSAYTKIRTLTGVTKITKFEVVMQWYQGPTLIGETVQLYDPRDYRDMNIALATAEAPAAATHVLPVLRIGSIDSGDEIEVSILGYQLEIGAMATSRTSNTRVQDEITIDPYNAMNQKVRLQIVPGFSSSDAEIRQILQGALEMLVSDNELVVGIPDVETLSVPITFAPGDLVDLTIEHQTGKRLAVFRDGGLLAEISLPEFTADPSSLTILGVGIELLKLSVFSRRAD